MTNLSRTNGRRGRRYCERSSPPQARQDGVQIEATVESILGLGEVTMRVLGKVEGVTGAAQRSLEVAQEAIDRVELRQFSAGLAAAGYDALMPGADDLHRAETPQAVGDDSGRGRDGAGSEYRYVLGRERLMEQAHQRRLTVRGGLHRDDERHLVFRSASSLAVRALTAGVISFLSPCVLPLVPAMFTGGLLAWAKPMRRAGRRLQIGAGVGMVIMGLGMITGLPASAAFWLPVG